MKEVIANLRRWPNRKLRAFDGELILWHVADHLLDWFCEDTANNPYENYELVRNLLREHFDAV